MTEQDSPEQLAQELQQIRKQRLEWLRHLLHLPDLPKDTRNPYRQSQHPRRPITDSEAQDIRSKIQQAPTKPRPQQ